MYRITETMHIGDPIARQKLEWCGGISNDRCL